MLFLRQKIGVKVPFNNLSQNTSINESVVVMRRHAGPNLPRDS